jgi:hypothetical protein
MERMGRSFGWDGDGDYPGRGIQSGTANRSERDVAMRWSWTSRRISHPSDPHLTALQYDITSASPPPSSLSAG